MFSLFADFWIHSNPPNVMEFSVIKRRFVGLLERYLERPEANLLEVQLDELLDG